MVEYGRRRERHDMLAELRSQLFAREIDRRQFMKRAAALGLAAPAATSCRT